MNSCQPVDPAPKTFAPLTPTAIKALVAFDDHVRAVRATPSSSDLAMRLGVSRQMAWKTLNKLVDCGCVEQVETRYRPWQLTLRGSRMVTQLRPERAA